MPFTLTMPKLSPTMSEGTIARWHKKVGEFVESGDLILEISTDKATVEYNALDGGWLKKVIVKEGEKAQVNAPLAVLTEQQNESIDGYVVETPEVKEAPKPKTAQPQMRTPMQTKPAQVVEKAPQTQIQPNREVPSMTKTTSPVTPYRPAALKEDKTLASPLAKALAKEKGVNINDIKGSGPHGRVVSRDIEEAEIRQASQSVETFEERPLRRDDSASQEIREVELSPLRKVIAERLHYSKTTIPHFYVRVEVDIEPIVKLREETKKLEKSFTINDFIIKAVATCLSKHPNINVGFNPDSQSVVHFPSVDLCIAVTIPSGLITPIVSSADRKTLNDISYEIKLLAKRAKDGKLRPEEYQGGSFTISNLGMFGVADFQAIINPPQAAILAIGTIQDVPVVKDGAIVPGKKIALTLSCDHRAIDGAEAAKFLQSLKQLIENPILFLSE